MWPANVIDRAVTSLVILVAMALAFWWFKSSYDAGVVIQHEAKVTVEIQKEVKADEKRTEKLNSARADTRAIDAAYQTTLEERASLDADKNRATYDSCRLSPDGLSITNAAIAAANGTGGVLKGLRLDPGIGFRNPGRDSEIAAGLGGNSEVPKRQPDVPQNVGGEPAKESVRERIKRLWSNP